LSRTLHDYDTLRPGLGCTVGRDGLPERGGDRQSRLVLEIQASGNGEENAYQRAIIGSTMVVLKPA
jgi:hypothetical protein